MKSEDLFMTSWLMVSRNRRRYKTVMVAIIIGTICFIIIRCLSDSVERKVADDLELIGEATVLSASWEDRKNYHPGQYFDRDVAALKRIPGVVRVAPLRSTGEKMTLLYGDIKRKRTILTAVNEEFWDTQQTPLLYGRRIDDSDVREMRKVCVIGVEIFEGVFQKKNPIGKSVIINSYQYEIVGVLGGKEQADNARTVFIPLSLAPHHFASLRIILKILIRTDTWSNVKKVRKQSELILKSLHPDQEHGIKVLYRAARLNRVNLIVFVIRIFCYAALIGVFIVGKIGLTSVMLAAVQERTKEIGLRKSMGATDRIIRNQFVLESVIISVMAGVVGVLGGMLCVLALQRVLDVQVSGSVISTSILMDLALTISIGVFAGWYPSEQAGKLDIVTAMRFE
jgi:putative ABC transport system permease protein